MTTATMHEAGEFVFGIGQLCSRCGEVLADGSFAGYPVGELVAYEPNGATYVIRVVETDPPREFVKCRRASDDQSDD